MSKLQAKTRWADTVWNYFGFLTGELYPKSRIQIKPGLQWDNLKN